MLNMSKSIYVYLNGTKYSKNKALQKLKNILNNYSLGEKLNDIDFNIVKDVLEYHPGRDEKIGCGIKYIEVVNEEMYGGRRFEIIRIDDSRQDFSYIKSLNKQNLHFKDVMKAMRFYVIEQTNGFKNKTYGNKKYIRCAITGLNIKRKDSHTDHKPPLTFDMLVFNFLKERKLQINDITVENTLYISCLDLLDKNLKLDWQAYHSKNAQLQIVLDHANLGQSKIKVPWDELKMI
jgi:hypothetical protein